MENNTKVDTSFIALMRLRCGAILSSVEYEFGNAKISRMFEYICFVAHDAKDAH